MYNFMAYLRLDNDIERCSSGLNANYSRCQGPREMKERLCRNRHFEYLGSNLVKIEYSGVARQTVDTCNRTSSSLALVSFAVGTKKSPALR